jgi:type IV secretory pathway TrbF-like protein
MCGYDMTSNPGSAHLAQFFATSDPFTRHAKRDVFTSDPEICSSVARSSASSRIDSG